MQSDLIDVVIGVVFVWFLLSMVLSALHEGFALLTHARAKHLWLGIGRLFDPDAGLLPSKLADVAWRMPFSGTLDLRPRAESPATGHGIAATTVSGNMVTSAVRSVGERWSTRPDRVMQGDTVKWEAKQQNQALYRELAPQLTEIAASGRLSKVTQILPATYSAAVLEVARNVHAADLLACAEEANWPEDRRTWLAGHLQPFGTDPIDLAAVEAFARPGGDGPGATADELRALWANAAQRFTARDLIDYYQSNPGLRDAIRRAAASVGADEKARAARVAVERWFEREMDQLSRFYRRQTRKIMLLLAIPLVLLTHANAIQTFSDLRADASLRQATASAATAATLDEIESFCATAESTPPVSAPTDPIAAAGDEFECARDVIDQATAFRVGLAWQDLKAASGATGEEAKLGFGDVGPYLNDALFDDWGIIGRLLTLVALMFGAQFWFDVLRRLVGFRKQLRGADDSGAAG